MKISDRKEKSRETDSRSQNTYNKHLRKQKVREQSKKHTRIFSKGV